MRKNHPRLYVGLEITTRPWKKPIFFLSIFLIILGFLFFYLPVINPLTMTILAMKLLEKFG